MVDNFTGQVLGADLVDGFVGCRIPASRTFQALRVEGHDDFGVLEADLDQVRIATAQLGVVIPNLEKISRCVTMTATG